MNGGIIAAESQSIIHSPAEDGMVRTCFAELLDELNGSMRHCCTERLHTEVMSDMTRVQSQDVKRIQ